VIHCWPFRPPCCAPQVLGDGACAKGRMKLLILLWRRQCFSPFQEPLWELLPVGVLMQIIPVNVAIHMDSAKLHLFHMT